jgi:uncharacterized protein YutE (UPF0331/DUF86 family)
MATSPPSPVGGHELAGVAAGLRNILVHGYLDVDPARV